jgi:hypothetical protein
MLGGQCWSCEREKGLEVGLGEGVVVADSRARQAPRYGQVGQELRDVLGGHRAPAVRVQGELLGGDVVIVAGVADEPLGQAGRLPLGDEPADHIPAEDVQDHVEVEVHPLHRALELGDIPGPDLVGRAGRGARPVVRRVVQLVPPLTGLARLGQNPVHRPGRADVDPLVQQGGIDLGWRLVDKARRLQNLQDSKSLSGRQGPRTTAPGTASGRGEPRPSAAIHGCPRGPESLAAESDRYALLLKLFDASHHPFSFGGHSAGVRPSRTQSFFGPR